MISHSYLEIFRIFTGFLGASCLYAEVRLAHRTEALKAFLEGKDGKTIQLLKDLYDKKKYREFALQCQIYGLNMDEENAKWIVQDLSDDQLSDMVAKYKDGWGKNWEAVEKLQKNTSYAFLHFRKCLLVIGFFFITISFGLDFIVSCSKS